MEINDLQSVPIANCVSVAKTLIKNRVGEFKVRAFMKGSYWNCHNPACSASVVSISCFDYVHVSRPDCHLLLLIESRRPYYGRVTSWLAGTSIHSYHVHHEFQRCLFLYTTDTKNETNQKCLYCCWMFTSIAEQELSILVKKFFRVFSRVLWFCFRRHRRFEDHHCLHHGLLSWWGSGGPPTPTQQPCVSNVH
jgi:hypothetical protein